jgi:hypothetical protein
VGGIIDTARHMLEWDTATAFCTISGDVPSLPRIINVKKLSVSCVILPLDIVCCLLFIVQCLLSLHSLYKADVDSIKKKSK